MRKNVLISGAGRIAFRHIEGLTKSRYEINIFVYDIYLNQIENIRKSIKSLKHNNIKLQYFTNIDDEITKVSKFDMVIVASTANKRQFLLEELFFKIESNFWLIEKPISQSQQGLHKILDDSSKQKNIYINHFRRVVPWHQEIKRIISKSKRLEVFVQSPELGIGCNISHFIDLVMFWTSQYPISVDTSNLEKKWIKSKRPGFFEINGKMVVTFNNGTLLNINSGKGVKKALIFGKDLDTGKSFEIDEINNFANIFENKSIYGVMSLQSEMTGKIFDNFILDNNCNLTTLGESVKGYEIVIGSLVEHWKNTRNDFEIIDIPIT